MEKKMSSSRSCLAVVLAAGEGQRMRSAHPKVLHALAGRAMLEHVLSSAKEAGADAFALVVGPGRQDVADVGRQALSQIEIFVQAERRGTAHAVLAARAAIEQGFDDLLIVFADTPLVRPATLARLREPLGSGAAVAALGFEPPEPEGYGRLVEQGGRLVAIREHKDASAAERALTLCNAGLMALDGRRALALLDAVGDGNAQGEFYLTDVVEAARASGFDCAVVRADADEVVGVNDRVQLAQAEAILQERLRAAAMRGGATLIDPSSVFLSWDTRLGRDVVIEPNVVFGPGVEVDDGARINAFSHIVGARIGPAASVGPFARLRPGAKLAEKVKIGNFVEIKAAEIGASAAVSHLSYVGDAIVGARANLGAGTITCNYDGSSKRTTEIGEGAFIGSNSSLVAPVRIGAGAYVGSGSVITKDVPADALAVARSRQVEKPNWAKAFREARQKKRED
jgi:bifunctional UDP-N-acetylglucosamine pyrophosphorylase / glucosamine-1-phosphate N-acetyltransferase